MCAEFSSRMDRLTAPYGEHKSGNKPNLDLRDVVPHYKDLCPFNNYPDVSELRRLLAQKLGQSESTIHITAGGDDALLQIILAVLEPGKNMVVTSPTFAMLARYSAIAGGEMRTVPWMKGEFPVADFIGQIDANTRLIVFASPNNPTGRTVPISVIRQICNAAPHAWIILDGVYMAFASEDISAAFLSQPRTAVVQSFSKAYGAAGLRVGYVMSLNAEFLLALRKVAQPYGISSPSLAAAAGLLQHEDQFRSAVEVIRQNRAMVFDALESSGYAPLPSEANFIFLPCDSISDALALGHRLQQHGIAVRSYPDDESLSNCLRIGVPYASADLKLLINAITRGNS